jgi:lipopolysaccharide export system protein LptA
LFFAGNAVAVQGDKILKSDKILPLTTKKKECESSKMRYRERVSKSGDWRELRQKDMST